MSDPSHPAPPQLRTNVDGLAVLMLNRPHKLNTLDDMLTAALANELDVLSMNNGRVLALARWFRIAASEALLGLPETQGERWAGP